MTWRVYNDAKSSCFLAFHATCARKEKLLLPMKSAHGAELVTDLLLRTPSSGMFDDIYRENLANMKSRKSSKSCGLLL